jgi:uncharacterized protein YbjT (DUF2867 family)
MTVLVAGATGNVGGELVRNLAGAGIEVRGLVRDSNRAALPAGVVASIGDLDRPETLASALAGVRGVFLLSGYRDMPGLLAEVRRAKVERVVLLSSSGCRMPRPEPRWAGPCRPPTSMPSSASS